LWKKPKVRADYPQPNLLFQSLFLFFFSTFEINFSNTLLIMENRICKLFGIEYPIIQAGMVWCSGWRLASAVSNHGGLGLIGAGSMHPETLREHIQKTKQATDKPFGVNVPLFYPELETIMNIIAEENVPVVFTSAGSPKKYTSWLKERGIKVAHVIASSAFALKCEEAGVDAIVAEGFEAGGHDGKEETTTLALIPAVRKVTSLPLLAAGGIATGEAMLAVLALGAEGVQIGSRFAVSEESSAHPEFKKLILGLKEGDTKLALKKVGPVRLVKNDFFQQVDQLEKEGADAETLKSLLGRGRAKKGMFEGDLREGELEIGQVSALIDEILPVKTIMENLLQEYRQAKARINTSEFDFD
jgi:enoyl-[acyl-carrier protein] reductase II